MMNEQIKATWQGLRLWVADHVAHAIPLFFCLLSLQNIQEFFYLLHPNLYISWAAGLALGFGLLWQAIKLSDMDWNMQDRKYVTVLATTVAFALVSGGIQAAAYSKYMWLVFAVPIGIALPTVGEVGVALSIAAHRQAVRARRVAHMQEELGDEMRLAMFDAIRTMNRSKLQDEVETGAITFARELIASTNHAMIADLQHGKSYRVVAQSEITVPVAMLADAEPAQPVAHAPKPKAKPVVAQPSPDPLPVAVQPTEDATIIDDEAQPIVIMPEFQTQLAELDATDNKILGALRSGACTPYAISKATGITLTTLKRKQGDKVTGRLPKLVAAGYIHNSSGVDGSEYRLAGE